MKFYFLASVILVLLQSVVLADGCPQTIIQDDLIGDGNLEKITLNCDDTVFLGAAIFDESGTKLFETGSLTSKEESDETTATSSTFFQIEKLRTGKSKQLIFTTTLTPALGCDSTTSIVEWINGKFVTTFSGSGPLEFGTPDKFGNRPVIDKALGSMPHVYMFDSEKQSYVKDDEDFKDYYRSYLKKYLSEDRNRKASEGRGWIRWNDYYVPIIETAYFLSDFDILRSLLKGYYLETEQKQNGVPWEGLPSETDEAKSFLDWVRNQKQPPAGRLPLLEKYAHWQSVKYYRTKLGLKALKVDDSQWEFK